MAHNEIQNSSMASMKKATYFVLVSSTEKDKLTSTNFGRN